jgi:hypothetical protein
LFETFLTVAPNPIAKQASSIVTPYSLLQVALSLQPAAATTWSFL